MAHGRGVAQQYHRLLFGESQRGLAVFEIVWDPDGQPVDYVIVGLNDKFAEMFGVMPTLSCAPGFLSLCQKSEMWQDALAVTAQSGVDQEIELFHLPTEAWLKVSLTARRRT